MGEALVAWIENLRDHATFGTTPALLQIPDEVLLDLAGDWGTGYFEPQSAAQRVADLITADQPHVTIHLGDVYYAGTDSDERNNLASWPMGSKASFSLNSNHEMYSGAHGYFDEIQTLFPDQQNTSYFALFNTHWLIIGLDSAYASDEMQLYMDGNLNAVQEQWLSDLMASHGQGRKIILLSHHQGLTSPARPRPRCTARCARPWAIACRTIGTGGTCTTVFSTRPRPIPRAWG